ncbi:Transcriptional regulator AcuR [Acaryochloris thomasi RCC1774]|uniref:Transcriptional regulator AcuR n=1 Tax=Acaryochloris thomasi RCC1774 TaxID=1764569 RepID=A0A2W1JL62_9CYAN|nr:TetR/AcrR family transcriptional regulator [Acaryochloris thomasi]PZD73926.1 Transcriptional regulator AcuR [Acaryochloris thomasi RCC1774]
MAHLKRTREDILQSVISTVHRQGLVATSLSELFEVSGASAGSFYNYFRSKNHLGHALIDFEWELLSSEVLEPALASSPNPIEQLLDMLHRLEMKQIQQPNCGGCLLGNLVVDLVEQDPAFREHLTRIFEQWEQTIAQALTQAQDQLQLDINPQHLAEQILSATEGAMLMGRLHQDADRIHRNFAGVRQLLKQALYN